MKFKIKFTLAELLQNSYKHAPVPPLNVSDNDNNNLNEVISVLHLYNLKTGEPVTVTYIFYQTTNKVTGIKEITGTGYFTPGSNTNTNNETKNSLRGSFQLTKFVTEIIAGKLFDNNDANNSATVKEKIFLLNNFSGKIVPLEAIVKNDTVTIYNYKC
jgi:hypothetical protein